MLVLSSDMSPLLGHQLKREIQKSRILRHIIAMITLIVIFSHDKEITPYIILQAMMTYTIFIMSTKMDLKWSLITLTIMFYLYNKENELDDKKERILNDDTIKHEDKITIIENIHKKKYIMYTIILGVIIIGSCIYSLRKEVQYGGNYSLQNFMLI